MIKKKCFESLKRMHKGQKRLCIVIVVLHKIVHICYILCMTNKQINLHTFFYEDDDLLMWSFLHKLPLTHRCRLKTHWCRLVRLQTPAEDFVPGMEFYFIKYYAILFLNFFIIYVTYICIIICLDTKDTIDEALMLKGSLSPYLDTHNEEESSYVTLSNGPYGKD